MKTNHTVLTYKIKKKKIIYAIKKTLPDINTKVPAWNNQQIIDQKPEFNGIELPSKFQIGDEVEILLEDFVIPGIVYAVQFCGNCTIVYDIAVEIGNSGFYTIIDKFRNTLRRKGETTTFDELPEIVPPDLKVKEKKHPFKIVTKEGVLEEPKPL